MQGQNHIKENWLLFRRKNLVEKSKEFGDLSVPEHKYEISTINEFLGKLIMIIDNGHLSERTIGN